MTDAEEVPAQLRRLWNLAVPAGRGRPAELDGPTVVRAAVELADREGLAGLTLAKLAKRVGYSPMSLYRYMGSMDELLELMVDAVAAAAEPPTVDPDDWRAGLRDWSRAQLRLAFAHPWLHQVPLTGPPAGPGQLRWLERGLEAMRRTGLDWPQRVGVMMLVSGYVRTFALQAEGLRRGREPSGMDQAQAEAAWAGQLARLIDPDRFPQLAELMASTTFTEPDSVASNDPADDPDFGYGLERILDGIAVSVAAADPTRR